ncbi:MAG: Sjogren's syndrome/scleroderma autoantigen 1 family protein [Halodesulfurarchaeum sp.]
MSENFDKEAERKRLREKYESDSADREVTERMSQLLLQGATMTNKHCETCGSPIFRYQGQAFCPTCQAGADGTQAETAGEDEAAPTEATAANQSNATTQPGAEAGTGGQSVDESAPGDAGHESVGAASTGTAELGGQTQPSPSTGSSNSGSTAGSTQTAVSQSLAETIVSLSERARESEDPNQAKKLLEAAREAAETLSKVQGR